MKNLIFVALIVSVMLVMAVGTAFAAGDDGYYPADKNAEAGSTTSSVEAGGEAGGSGGPIVSSVVEEIWNQPDVSLSLRSFSFD